MRFLDNWKAHRPLGHSLACPCVWKLGQALFCGEFWGMGRHEAVLEVSGIKSHLVPNSCHLEWGRGLEGRDYFESGWKEKTKAKTKLCLMLGAENWGDS